MADATFDVQQDITLNFDSGGETLWLAAGSRSVKTHSGGLGSGEVANAVNGAVDKAVKSMVDAACIAAQPKLAAMIARKQEMIDQLRTIDDQANAWVDRAEFVPDGMVLRGTISVAGRNWPVVKFDETLEEDGYTGFLSWIPGGRIDQFAWTWSWFGAGTPGSATHTSRFLLQRPKTGASVSHWGGLVGLRETTLLPGLRHGHGLPDDQGSSG